MIFDQDDINTEIPCEECFTGIEKGIAKYKYTNTADMIIGHLIEAHGYTVAEAEKAVTANLEAYHRAEEEANEDHCNAMCRATGIDNRMKGEQL